MHGAPFWGAGRLRWDQELLAAEGKLQLEALTLFFEGSAAVVSFGAEDLPSNALPPEVFDLAATGSSEVTLFVHLDSRSAEVQTSSGDSNEEGIRRVVHRVSLQLSHRSLSGPPAYELGTFKSDAAGLWSLAPRSLAPCVSVLNSAFEAHVFYRVDAVVAALAKRVQDELDAGILSGTIQAATKIVQRGVYSLSSVWRQIRGGSLNPHPYELFRHLESVYFDLCSMDNHSPAQIDYLQHQLGNSFGALLDELEELLGAQKTTLPHLAFRKHNGMWLCQLQPHMKKAGRAYLLLKKASASQALDLRTVKLSSSERLPHVHSHALRGVPFELVKNPAFSHHFASTVEFYALSPGDEWDYAVDEKVLAFYDAENLVGVEAFLYYRED